MPPPIDKAKAAGISTSSFHDLKAHLAKQEQELTRKKAAGESTSVTGVARPEKKVPKWLKANAGVQRRAIRDIEVDESARRTAEDARVNLEKKAKQYDLLRKGKTGGLTDKQFSELVVDFDSKYQDTDSDEDESSDAPGPNPADDDIVEWEDDFGRTRSTRRSEVPREVLDRLKRDEDASDMTGVIYNPVGYMQYRTYEKTAEEVAKINAEYAPDGDPEVHFDSTGERRHMGAAHIRLGTGDARKQKMAELGQLHEETLRGRAEHGAVDVRPGEVEGMRADEDFIPGRSRAQEKRKREAEERRKLIEAKRRKKEGKGAGAGPEAPKEPPPSLHTKSSPPSAATDPFAALEAQKLEKGKGPSNPDPPQNAADAFLAQLEHDMLKKRS